MALAATSRTEKRARVLHVIAAHPTASNREIGRLAGVDHKTVAALRRSGGETEIPHSGGIKASRQIPRSPMNGEISQPKTLPRAGDLKFPTATTCPEAGKSATLPPGSPQPRPRKSRTGFRPSAGSTWVGS
jgi:hypothetical protein